MRLKSIKAKLALAVCGCCFIIIGILVARTTVTSRKQAIESAQEHARAVARDYSGQVKAEIDADLSFALGFHTLRQRLDPQIAHHANERVQQMTPLRSSAVNASGECNV